MARSRIEWTDATWNPVTGCSKVSEGCRNCYAERMSKRLQAMGIAKYKNGFEVTVHPDTLDIPLKWKQPRRIFVNSMSDLFHESVPEAYIHQVFDVMLHAPQHRFQLLTKRSLRLVELDQRLVWPPNVWMGVSVETRDYLHRIDDLRAVGAVCRFLSLEPLLGPLHDMDLSRISWVIAGGESGPGARPMDPEWVRSIRDQCLRAGVSFFFKQWGGTRKKHNGRVLDGRTWDMMPELAHST